MVLDRAIKTVSGLEGIMVVMPDEHSGSVKIDGDPERLAECFGNILRNAYESMNGRGVITLAVEEADLHGKNSRFYRITVSDTGPGIETDVLPKIFEPFFTTKQNSRGLGLSVAYSIAKQHGGTITAESGDRGATIAVYLPASEPVPEVTTPSTVSSKKLGKVLLMDDEESIRDVGRRMLHELGHTVVTADSGEEAFHLYRKAFLEHKPFDAVILDLSVDEGMDGIQTMQAIREINPHANIIVSTGYTNDPVLIRYAEYGFNSALPKPYDFGKLTSVLSDTLP
jgi:CheY-like chemotaxis protein